jgi:hypothetical protein
MKVSPEFLWLVPYVELALPHLPKGKKVTRLGAWRFGGRCGKKEQAAIFTDDFRSFRIYLHTHTHPRALPEPRPYSRIEVLENLAHELAHLINMNEHTPAHRKLEAKLTMIFMHRLEKDGYISEEREEANV